MVLACIQVCWYRSVQSRIPFAGANLSLSSKIVSKFPTLFAVTAVCLGLQFVWMLLWVLALIGVAAPHPKVVIQTPVGSFQSALCSDLSYDASSQCLNADGCCLCTSGDDETTALLSDGMCDRESSSLNKGIYFAMVRRRGLLTTEKDFSKRTPSD